MGRFFRTVIFDELESGSDLGRGVTLSLAFTGALPRFFGVLSTACDIKQAWSFQVAKPVFGTVCHLLDGQSLDWENDDTRS